MGVEMLGTTIGAGVGQGGACPRVPRSPTSIQSSERRGHAPATPADRRHSPEEGVGAVVVDLGLGAAAAQGRTCLLYTSDAADDNRLV